STTTTTQPDTCTCGEVNRDNRIIYGEETEAQEYPWMTALVATGKNRSFCGGSLINDRWVLTAAHCLAGLYGVSGVENIEVLLSEHSFVEVDGEERYGVSQVIMHPDYNTYPWYNGFDFGLVELATPVDFSSSLARPICLPVNDTELYNSVMAIVTGWGQLEPGKPVTDVLMEVTIQTITNQQCQQSLYGQSGYNILHSMICAGTPYGHGGCMGDSGGPVITLAPYKTQKYYEQIGVVSFGSAYCNYYGVYARITAALEWIRSIAENGTAIICVPPLQI
ncbi:unnamed protein product, partial [Meganyctiphanes norvegica]